MAYLGTLPNHFKKQRTKETRLRVFTFYLILVLFVVSILYALRFAFQQTKTERIIRILCFGDSLTAGSGRDTNILHPYSAKLQERFDNHDKTELGPSKRPIFRVDNAGIPGERAKEEMLPRLYQTLQRARAKYSWVIILGGTNDMKKYRENAASFDIPEGSKSIFHALVNLHNISHSFGAKTVAVSIPDRECEGSGTCFHLKEVHLKINELLKEFSSRNKEKVILADLASEVFLPRDERLWGDPIHFNKQGYDKMADVIYNAMKEHV